MSIKTRMFWLLSLLFLLVGCGNYRQVGKVRQNPDDPFHDLFGKMRYGDQVRLTLEDGTILYGQVEGRAPTLLTIELATEPFGRQEIQAGQIFILERKGEKVESRHVLGIVVGLTLVGLVVAGYANSFSTPSWGN